MYGKKLRELRSLEGWTQLDVAKKLGVSKQTYSHYENEQRSPGLDMIRKLAEVYNVDLDSLFGNVAPTEYDIDLVSTIETNMKVREFPALYEVSTATKVPFYGSIAAGALATVEGVTSNDVEHLHIPNNILGKFADSEDLLAMKVNGESMNLIVPDGSIVIGKTIDHEDLKDNDIVIYSIDGVYSMKRFRRDVEDKVLIFSPESSDQKFRDNVVPYSTDNDLVIHAKVVWYSVTLD